MRLARLPLHDYYIFISKWLGQSSLKKAINQKRSVRRKWIIFKGCKSICGPTHFDIFTFGPTKNGIFLHYTYISILLYGCTTWTLTKRLEKKLDDNYTRMLRTILNKFWRQHPTRHQLYGHLPPITKTIQVRRTRHAGHCWRSRDELISDVILWTPTYGRSKAGRPARTYIQQLCEDTRCSPEDLPGAMNDREKWRERVRDIRADGTTWWWWYIYIEREIEWERGRAL